MSPLEHETPMITSLSCYVDCGCRSAGECGHNMFAEIDALYLLVDEFLHLIA